MRSVITIRTMLELLGFSQSAATYLTGTCGIYSLDEIAYLDGIDDVDTMIKGVTNPGGTVMTGSGYTAVTSHNNGIPVSIRAVANLKLCVYYLKHMERFQLQPIANAINLALLCSYRDQQGHEFGFKKTAEEPDINDKDCPRTLEKVSEYLASQIEFPDGRSDEYTDNVIAENMYAQCDIEGRKYNLIEGIIYHKTDVHAIEPADMYIKHGINKKVRKTSKVWHLCVEWKYGTTSWEHLEDLKESNPVESAEYVAAKSLIDTPDFFWWAPRVLRKRTISIDDVTKLYHKGTHKLGIEAPKSWDDCVRLDKENDNNI
jgi:hypothetical protein